METTLRMTAPEGELLDAADRGDLPAVQALLLQGADPNARDCEGDTVLATAAYHGHVEIARILLAAGADVNASKSGETPLSMAAHDGHTETAQLLLEHGADINAEDQGGLPPLSAMFAYGTPNLPTLRLFLAQGARVDIRDHQGCTELFYAAHGKGEREIVIALLEAGADPNARDNEGETVLMWAAEGAPAAVVQALVDAGADPN